MLRRKSNPYVRCHHCKGTGVDPDHPYKPDVDPAEWLCPCCHGRGAITFQRQTMFNRQRGVSHE